MAASLSKDLKKFADNFAPSKGLEKEAGGIIDRLSRYLREGKFEWKKCIARIVPLGSFKKKSSLRFMMDLDIVIYLNELEFPFEIFVRDLKDYIEKNKSYSDCKFLKRGLFLIADDTLHIDLLPATNRAQTSEENCGLAAGDVQFEQTLSYIQMSTDPFQEGYNQSTALSEKSVDFVKKKNNKYHCSTVTRLAKYWSKTVCIPDFHNSRSSIIEYIAIRSCEIEQKRGKENTLAAFRKFLKIISSPNDIKIFWMDNYQRHAIPDSVRNQIPLLLDPTNPYNNMIREDNKHFMMEMSKFARVTLQRLAKATTIALKRKPTDFRFIFEPQPLWKLLPFRLREKTRPRRFAVAARSTTRETLTMPKTIIKSRMEASDKEMIENFLFSYTEALIATYKHKGDTIIPKRVVEDIRTVLEPDIGWWNGGASTLQLPFSDENENPNVLSISFSTLSDVPWYGSSFNLILCVCLSMIFSWFCLYLFW